MLSIVLKRCVKGVFMYKRKRPSRACVNAYGGRSVCFYIVYWLLFQILLKARFSLSMKSSAMSFVKHSGGSRRRMFVEAQPVKQCWL